MKQFPTHIVAVYGVIKNDKDEILLVKTFHRKTWEFPGGQVETGENLIDALKREAMEESGVEITVDKLYCVSSNTGTHQGYDGYGIVPTKVILGFACTYMGGELRTSDETFEVIWAHESKVSGLLTTQDMINKYNKYLSFDGKIEYLEYISRPEYILKLTRDI